MHPGQEHDCLHIYALSAMLRHTAARDIVRDAWWGRDLFPVGPERILAYSLVTGNWKPVEESISMRAGSYSRMGILIAAVERTLVPGDDAEWAAHLVRILSKRRWQAIASTEIGRMAKDCPSSKSGRLRRDVLAHIAKNIQNDPRTAIKSLGGVTVSYGLGHVAEFIMAA